MDEFEQAEMPETDDRFPTGPWEGFWQQHEVPPGKHQMELKLEFRGGKMIGEGKDWVGEFNVRGKYDTGDGKCHFTKHYAGKHSVHYSGFNEGKGIWGTWELPQYTMKGGFHIWPLGEGAGTGDELAEEADLPLGIEGDLIGVGIGDPMGQPSFG